MAVDDHGVEASKKAAREIIPGKKDNYLYQVTDVLRIKNIGSSNNLGSSLNSEFVYEDLDGFATALLKIIIPTNGKIKFEGSLDGSEYFPITFRSITNNTYSSLFSTSDVFIGSIIAWKFLRVRVVQAGSSTGSVFGRLSYEQSILEGQEFGNLPHNKGAVTVRKTGSFTTAQTGTVIWQPVIGNKFVLTDLILFATGTTDGDIIVFDELDVSGQKIVEGTIDVALNAPFTINSNFVTPYVSVAINNALKITTTGTIKIFFNFAGYEINE